MDRLSRLFGQQFFVENRCGASDALGIEAAVKSPADAFLSTPSLSVVIIVPQLRKVPFDPLKDLVPVTQFVEGTLLVAMHPSVPVNWIQELAAYGKQSPGTGAHPASARTDI
jgi:putative tricarboxylic transport membrane protein